MSFTCSVAFISIHALREEGDIAAVNLFVFAV